MSRVWQTVVLFLTTYVISQIECFASDHDRAMLHKMLAELPPNHLASDNGKKITLFETNL